MEKSLEGEGTDPLMGCTIDKDGVFERLLQDLREACVCEKS